MRRLTWCESTTAGAPPRVRVERFCATKSRYRVHLLGELRCKETHFRFGENTMPCLAPDACPFCADPAWKKRREFFAPALVMDRKHSLWVPTIVVLTPGGWNKLAAYPAGPHRGRLLDVWRVQQGTTNVLQVKELSRIDPVVPSFEIEPHLLRLWFPEDESVPVAEVPPPVPFQNEEPPRPAPIPEPTKLDVAAGKRLHEYVAKMRGETPAEEEPAEEKPTAPAPVATPPARPDEPAPVGGLVEQVLTRYPLDASRLQYGPRVLERAGITPEIAEEVLTHGTAEIICREQKEKGALRNGKHTKGGA